MFEIRPFTGTAEELSEFVVSAWLSTYQQKMAVPLWCADYFRWQLSLEDSNSRRRVVSVYENDVLAGVVMYFPVSFSLQGKPMTGGQASWLSVPAKLRGQGLARQLNEAIQEEFRVQELQLRLGFGYRGSRVSLGPAMWRSLQKKSSLIEFPRRVGFWVRVLNAKRAAAWNVNRTEALGAMLARPFIGSPKLRRPSNLRIRPVCESDLTDCLKLAEHATAHCDLRLVWNRERLAKQLGLHGFSRALVAEIDGQVRGCIAYHVLPISGRTIERVGIIDLVFLSELPRSVRTELLNSVLLDLQQDGAILAMKLRTGDYPRGTFLSRGWFYMPADSDVIANWAETPGTLPSCRTMHVLWR